MKLEFSESFRAVWRILPNQAQHQAVVLANLMAIATVLETLGLGMIIPLLGSLIPSESVTSSSSGGIIGEIVSWFAKYSLETIVIGLLLLLVAKNGYLAGLAYFQSKFVFGLEAELSKRLLGDYLDKPYSFFASHNSAHIIRNIVGEVSNFCHNAVAPLCGLVAEILVAAGILILLVAVNPYGAVMMAVVLGVMGALFHFIIRRRVAHWGEARQYHEGMRLQKLQESFGAIKEIKLADLQPQFCSDYARHTDGSCVSGRRQQSIQSLPRLLLEILAVLALVLVVLPAKEASRASMLPILGLYAAAAFRLMPSANRILNALQAIRFAKPSIDVLAKEFTLGRAVKRSLANSALSFECDITFKDVGFRYVGQDSFVFKSVNLQIKKGEVVCVVGPSGAGKSTLVDVLCGLLPPCEGQVLVDGHDIADRELLWHRHIAYVPQTIFLIDGTIRENITLGIVPSLVDEKRLQDVMMICGLQELIDNHSDGLNAQVGERGVKISGGQKQRIGLAREIYRGRDVLILDEATNALDSYAENEVVANISRAKNKMTVIWITHGATPLKLADKRIVVQDGCVSVKNASEGRV